MGLLEGNTSAAALCVCLWTVNYPLPPHHTHIGDIIIQNSTSSWASRGHQFKFFMPEPWKGTRLREATLTHVSIKACVQNTWKKMNETHLCSHVPVLILDLFLSIIFHFLWFFLLSESRSCKPAEILTGRWQKTNQSEEKKNGKRKECVWLTQVCCCWRAVWEPRRHCVPRGSVTTASDGEAKKRQAWETCTLTFLNQIWQSGGQPTAYHLQFLLIHNQKLSKWGRNWERGGGMQVITSLFTGRMRATDD